MKSQGGGDPVTRLNCQRQIDPVSIIHHRDAMVEFINTSKSVEVYYWFPINSRVTD